MRFVLCFRLDPKIAEHFVDIAVAACLAMICSEIGSYPTVTMGRMSFVNLGHQCNNLFSFQIPLTFVPFLPLVVPGAADTHELTQILHIVVSGKQFYDFEFFGFKRMYSCSPVAVVCTA